MATPQSYSIYEGNDHVLAVQVMQGASPLNLAGITAAKFWLAKKVSSPSPLVEKTLGAGVTVTDAAQGRLEIALANADTRPLKGSLYCELELVNADGRRATVMVGTVTVVPTVIPSA
ncbi:MAG TPA: hypothetical protein VGD46_15845 [Rhizobacter sp.]